MPRIAVITPTSDRPVGLGLCERWMQRQGFYGDVVWVVSDGGKQKAPTPKVRGWEVVHIQNEHRTGPHSIADNIKNGALVALDYYPDIVAVVEDDDYYAGNHLHVVSEKLEHATMVGNDHLRYYHIQHRRYRTMRNRGSSLCQTAMQTHRVERLIDSCDRARVKDSYGIDGIFWSGMSGTGWGIDLYEEPVTVIGIKGIPGRRGYGIGHRQEAVEKWDKDEDGSVLRSLIGADAEVYNGIAAGC